MKRPDSTVVCIPDAPAPLLAQLAQLPNVRVAADDADPLTFALRAHAPFAVHRSDPLADLASAWRAYFDGEEMPGHLEMAIEDATAVLRIDRAMLPDYYVVLDPEALAPTARHWFFGVLAEVAVHRVVPAAPTARGVRAALAHLGPGPWWPEPADDWLRGVARAVPDRVGLRDDASLSTGQGTGGARWGE